MDEDKNTLSPEAQTRQKIIDKRLKKAGWDVTNSSQVISEHKVFHQISTTSGVGYSDYVLLDSSGNPLAVVEAKKSSLDARQGREQARQYADGFEKAGYERPFIFYTNGHDIFFWNDSTDIPRKVYGFLTRDDLEGLLFKRKEKLDLSSVSIETNIAGRPYQIEAIRKIIENFSQNKRSALLVMATGTGKTRTAISIVDILMRSHWVKRVLFLADRNALLRQAKNSFTEHLPHAPRYWIQKGKFPKDKRVYFSTYPSMLSLYHKISHGFFDLIICDESHRSIYNRYKEILDHFYSYKLGLTATPVDYIDRNTFRLFETQAGNPSFNFSYEDALNNKPPYLAPYQVLSVQSRFQMEGIKAGQLPVSVQKKLVAEGKDLGEINFEGTDLERKVTNSGTNELIVQEFMNECIKDENGVIPGKSIIFAISHKHALRLENAFQRLFPKYRGHLARVIDSHDPRANTEGGLLDQFKNPNDPLKVAISVDMLDTGIDVPEIVNLVFAKPVFSRAKFWQMIGRGTRLCPNLFGPEKNKKNFLIIDHWNNFSYFEMTPEGKEPSTSLSVPEQLFKAKLKKADSILSYSLNHLKEKIIQSIRKDIETLPMESVPVKDKFLQIAQIKEDSFWKGFNQNSIEFLQKQICPLMKTKLARDFHSLRFDIDILESQIALIHKDEIQIEKCKEKIQKKISELPLTLNQVQAKENVISKANSQKFWNELSEESLEELRLELRHIMQYQSLPTNEMEKLDLEDITLIKKTVEFGPEMEQSSVDEYRKKLEFKIRNLLLKNEVLQRLKDGKGIDDADIENLVRILQSEYPYITLNNLQQVYDNKTAKFVDFIKHILGLEKLQTRSEIITESFDHFIKTHNDFSSQQIQFLRILKSFIIERGRASKENLISLPFTNLHPDGITGVFTPPQIDEILSFVTTLNNNSQ